MKTQLSSRHRELDGFGLYLYVFFLCLLLIAFSVFPCFSKCVCIIVCVCLLPLSVEYCILQEGFKTHLRAVVLYSKQESVDKFDSKGECIEKMGYALYNIISNLVSCIEQMLF